MWGSSGFVQSSYTSSWLRKVDKGECATCHLYLANKPSPPPVKPPGEEELDMLGYAIGYREGESRLGCQILVGEELGAWCESGGVLGLLRY